MLGVITFNIARMYDDAAGDLNDVWVQVRHTLESHKTEKGCLNLPLTPASVLEQVKASWEPSGLQAYVDNLDNDVLLMVGRFWKDDVENKLSMAHSGKDRFIFHQTPCFHFSVSKRPVDSPDWMKRKPKQQ